MINKTKRAWFQGSDEAVDKVVSNDPAKLGYPKEVGYDRKPMATQVGEDSRPWEQKWFEGAANSTKKNLGPSGAEFKAKQDWQRIPADEKIANAKLSAGFTRTAKPSDSFWTIYTTDKKTGVKTAVLKATLASIWGKELDEKSAHKSATPEYGKAVLSKIGELGFSKVAYLLTGEKSFLKTSSMTKKADELEMIADTPVEAEDEDAALDAEVEQTATESGVTKDLVLETKNEVETTSVELIQNTAPESTAEVFVKLQDAGKMLEEAAEEMGEIEAKLRSKNLTSAQKIKLVKLAQEAQDAAIETMTATDPLLDEGKQAISEAPKAEEAVEVAKEAIEEAKELSGGGNEELEVEAPAIGEELEGEGEAVEGLGEEVKEEGEELEEAASYVGKFLKARADVRKQALAAGEAEEKKYAVVPDGAPKDGKGEIDAAHPGGGHDLVNVSVGGKPVNNGEKFETVTEAQNVDLEVANKMPKGTLNASSKLAIKTAAVDEVAKKYWAEYFGIGDAASKQYGKDITKDVTPGGNVKAAVEEGQSKVIRAYELAEIATEKGFCERTASAKKDLVKQILGFDDNSFVSFKKMIDSAPVRKAFASEGLVAKASVKIPQVGLVESGHEDTETAFVSRLSNIGWSK